MEGKKNRIKAENSLRVIRKLIFQFGDTFENEKDTFNNHDKPGLFWDNQDIWTFYLLII